jgi:hypothetical protein
MVWIAFLARTRAVLTPRRITLTLIVVDIIRKRNERASFQIYLISTDR